MGWHVGKILHGNHFQRLVITLCDEACRALLLFYFLTPTANAESWAVEAFSLCMFLSSTKLSEWSPMERRAPAQGSSRDQRI